MAERSDWRRQSISAAEALRVAGDIEAETRYRLQLAREAFERGRAVGRAEAAAETEAWRALARQEVLDPETIDNINKIAAAEHKALEERRWGPGGRYHFADPRPGGFPGRDPRPAPEPAAPAADQTRLPWHCLKAQAEAEKAEAEAEAETELEAGL